MASLHQHIICCCSTRTMPSHWSWRRARCRRLSLVSRRRWWTTVAHGLTGSTFLMPLHCSKRYHMLIEIPYKSLGNGEDPIWGYMQLGVGVSVYSIKKDRLLVKNHVKWKKINMYICVSKGGSIKLINANHHRFRWCNMCIEIGFTIYSKIISISC